MEVATEFKLLRYMNNGFNKKNKEKKMLVVVYYLFGRNVGRRNVTVALANNGWVLASSNGIHQPMCVVIVYHMDKSPSAPENSKEVVTYKVVLFMKCAEFLLW
jgi:hypothetical protein